MSPEGSSSLLEFQRVEPDIEDAIHEAGKLPHFQRLYSRGAAVRDHAEEVPPTLDVDPVGDGAHRLGFGEHRVRDLGDGQQLTAPRPVDLASAAGSASRVRKHEIGYRQPINGVVLPDAWSPGHRRTGGAGRLLCSS